MIELTFENTPLGIVRVTVERLDREGFGTWNGRSLRLVARDAKGEQARVFDYMGHGAAWIFGASHEVDGTASTFDRAIPVWMQTDALQAAFDEFCKGDQTPLRVILRPQKNPSFDGSNFFDVIILRGEKNYKGATVFSFAGSTTARSTQSLREIRGMIEGDFPFPTHKVESITYECADAQPVF
jgi:hypothetical protein